MVMYQNVPLGPSGEDLTERVIEGCDYTMGSDLDRHRAARGPVSLPSHTPSDPASVRVAASPSDMASSGVQARREESKRERLAHGYRPKPSPEMGFIHSVPLT